MYCKTEVCSGHEQHWWDMKKLTHKHTVNTSSSNLILLKYFSTFIAFSKTVNHQVIPPQRCMLNSIIVSHCIWILNLFSLTPLSSFKNVKETEIKLLDFPEGVWCPSMHLFLSQIGDNTPTPRCWPRPSETILILLLLPACGRPANTTAGCKWRANNAAAEETLGRLFQLWSFSTTETGVQKNMFGVLKGVKLAGCCK